MIKVNAQQIRENPIVVYTLHDEAGAVQYIGFCKYKQLLSTPDARKNLLFGKIFSDDAEIFINPICMVADHTEARNYVWDWLKHNPRPYMMKYGGAFGQKKKIKCVETGEIFESVKAASEYAGVPKSTMSMHLRNWSGVDTVRGKRYVYDISSIESVLKNLEV